jgi:2-dehydropantoate 2-reductase
VLDLIRGLINEICAVASMEGVVIDSDEAYRYVVTLAQEAPEHRTSFLMDLLLLRKTEIDSLNGAIVAKAMTHDLDVPYNKAIVSIVKTLENTYETRIRMR